MSSFEVYVISLLYLILSTFDNLLYCVTLKLLEQIMPPVLTVTHLCGLSWNQVYNKGHCDFHDETKGQDVESPPGGG